MKKKVVFFSLNIILSVSLFAGGFHNIMLRPSNPNTEDTLIISYSYTALSNPAKIFSHAVTVSDSIVHVSICFGEGQMQAGVTLYDTINIGVFPITGNYHVTMYMNLTSLLDTLCTNSMWYDSAETSFTITGPTGLSFYKEKDTFSFYPNPTNDKLSCTVTDVALNSTIHITTIEGRVIFTGIPVTQPNFEIDVSTLPAGIYFLQLSNEQQRVVKKFVKY